MVMFSGYPGFPRMTNTNGLVSDNEFLLYIDISEKIKAKLGINEIPIHDLLNKYLWIIMTDENMNMRTVAKSAMRDEAAKLHVDIRSAKNQ